VNILIFKGKVNYELLQCHEITRVLPDIACFTRCEVGRNQKSYRALALKFHPDHHPDIEGSESRFMEVSRAFKALELHYQTSGIQK
jgi:hypothetical protein